MYYTLDGSTPTKNSATVGVLDKFYVANGQTVKAIAVVNGVSSDVVSRKYEYKVRYAMITTPSKRRVIEIETNFANTTYYTTDGTEPTRSSSTFGSGDTVDNLEFNVKTWNNTLNEFMHEGKFRGGSGFNNMAYITEIKATNSSVPEIEIQFTPRASGMMHRYRVDGGRPQPASASNGVNYFSDIPFSIVIPSGSTVNWTALNASGTGTSCWYCFTGYVYVEE